MQRTVVVMAIATACSGHDPGTTPAPITPAPITPVVPTLGPDARMAPAIVAPTRRLPEGATPLGYELRLELDPDAEMFTGTVKIRVQLDAASDHVWLHADELDVTSASYDDGPLTRLAITGDRMVGFSFGKVIQPRVITLALSYTGHTSHDQEGLFRQQSDKRWFVFSQGESEFARRFVPCFDEPQWKTPWQVTLVVPKGEVGVSNMPVAHDATLADGRRELAFAETPPMPSYLVAIAVGPFAIVDAGVAGRAKVPVRVVVASGWRAKVGVVAARMPAILAAVETYTDDPLPWPKLDVVVVPQFFGAMENPGLITFEAGAIVGDPKRLASEFVHIAAHEVAHQWFGNLVTPAWWDDLWLSEAFASWLGDKVAAQLGFSVAAELQRTLTRESALDADDEAGAEPLHRAITFDPENEFDAISYDKGESVLATFETWLGAEPFRRALRAYLGAHRNGNVTTVDLVRALVDATTPQAGAALQGYVDHAGPPVLELGVSCDGAPRLVGHARDRLNIPVCVRYPGPHGDAHACGLVGEHTELALAACPAWLVPDDVGYYEVVWTTQAPRGPMPSLAKLSPAAKLGMAHDLAAAAARGDLSVRDALAELTTLAASHDVYGEYAAISLARALDALVDDATRPRWQAWLATRFSARLDVATAFRPPRAIGVEHRAAVLALVTAEHLPAATVRTARQQLDAAAAKQQVVDPLVVLAAGDDRAAFDALAATARDTKDADTRENAVDMLGWFAAPQAEAAVALVGTLPPGLAWQAIEPYFDRGSTRTAAWQALRGRLSELLAKLTPQKAGEVIDAMASLCDRDARGEIAKLFDPQVARILEGRARLDHALGAIDRCVARRAKAGDLAALL